QGHYENLSRKMQEHWSRNPWNTNPKWREYKDTNILIQSNLEYSFLESLEKENGIDWVKENVFRGDCFWYEDPRTSKKRLYISDFKILDSIWEVKGAYTWNKHGKDKDLENLNKAKIESVLKSGLDFNLILDGER